VALLDRGQRGCVGEQVGQQVAAALTQSREPAEVVEPGIVDLEVGEVAPERTGRAPSQPQR
jgi:hypothetical protein